MKCSHLLASLFIFSSVASASNFKNEMTPATFNRWTGFYAGLNIGLVNHTMSVTDTNAVAFMATIDQVSNARLIGGAQLGYRKQVDLSSVSGIYGVEVSAQFSNSEFNKQYGSPFALYQLDAANKLESVYLLELLGGIAANNTMLFITGGLSWINISGKTVNLDSIPFFNDYSVKKNVWGTTLGAGIEYAFNENWSARFKANVMIPNTYNVYDDVDDQFGISNHIVEASLGINYQFV